MNFSSISGKNWTFKKFNSSDITYFSEKFSLTETVAKLISIRKKNIIDVKSYLDPKVKNLLPNPSILKDMETAVNRTYKSLLNNDLVGIFGDYDVDGASSTALLAKYFDAIKQKTKIYIPDRQKEGYGPTKGGFEKLINDDVKIIFTVDCGTLSYDAIEYSQKRKIDVIVLDHHQSETKLPQACAIVNPNRYDDNSGLNYLCAAGVCFVFLVALNRKLRENKWFSNNKIKEPDMINFLDLVSLGTVCDVVPLIGLNRAIVKQGLRVLKRRSNLGLKTLYDICNTQSQPTTFDLGYKLGPRINAGGRVGKSSHGAELLISNDPKKTYQIANELEKSNKERQAIEQILSEEINLEVKKYHNHPVLVMAGKNWHEGVIGIIAARVKEKYNKPTILISIKNNIGKGSARSIVDFDIGSQIINATQMGILLKGGGHKMAAGFSLKEENISKFRDFLIKRFEKSNIDNSKNEILYIDSILAPSALNESFYNDINSLAPFGSGNNEPKFIIQDLKLLSSKIISNNHIKSILIGKDGSVFSSFLWNGISSKFENYLTNKNKKKFSIAGKIRLNEWRGEKKFEFIIEDLAVD